MKYIVPITRIEHKNIEVFAPDRDKALEAALLTNPGFTADYVFELDEEGNEKETHEFLGKCESCNKAIWEGEAYSCSADEDCVMICSECMKKE